MPPGSSAQGFDRDGRFQCWGPIFRKSYNEFTIVVTSSLLIIYYYSFYFYTLGINVPEGGLKRNSENEKAGYV